MPHPRMQVFACLYTLTKNRQASSLRMSGLRVLLEFLQVGQICVGDPNSVDTTGAAACWQAFKLMCVP